MADDKNLIPGTDYKKEIGSVNGQPIFERKFISEPIESNIIRTDASWVARAFLVPEDSFEEEEGDITIRGRYFSTVMLKHTDTTLGGNFGINSRPQFNWYSDIRSPGRIKKRLGNNGGNININESQKDGNVAFTSGNYGLGRYYSEAIDDNTEEIYLTFGVPQYNSLTGFFSGAYDREMSILARKGRVSVVDKVMNGLGNAIGSIFAIAAYPYITIPVWASRSVNTFFQFGTKKYYTLKPTMPLYWLAVQTLVNNVMVNMGIYPRTLDGILKKPLEQKQGQFNTGLEGGDDAAIQLDYFDYLSEMAPDIFDKERHIDVLAMAARAFRTEYEFQKAGANGNLEGYLTQKAEPSVAEKISKVLANFMSFGTYYGTPEACGASQAEGVGNPTKSSDEGSNSDEKKLEEGVKNSTDLMFEMDPRISPSGDKCQPGSPEDWVTYHDITTKGGVNYAIFKVDGVNNVSESFSNSIGESSISSTLNSVSSTARSARFSFADGNIGLGPIETLVKAGASAITNLVGGALEAASLGLSNAGGVVSGSAYVDIPKVWENSSANLPRINYTMKLVSPYGHPISQLQNIYIPLCMLLAGTLPLSAGHASYTSPFLVQVFHRGKHVCRLGMIDNVSVSRGVTNLPFTNKGKVLSIEVSFSITDLSSVMSMPISSGGWFEDNPDLNPDSVLYDYLGTLVGMSLYDQLDWGSRARALVAKKLSKWQVRTSPAYWGMVTGDIVNNVLPILPRIRQSVSNSLLSEMDNR